MRTLRLNTQQPVTLQPWVSMLQDSDGGVTLLDQKRGTYWRGNASAYPMLQKLAQPHTIVEIVQHMHEQFDADRATIERDVTAVLSSLLEAKLIRRVAR